MSAQDTTVNTRSPFYVRINAESTSYAILEISVWTGPRSPFSTDIKYSLRKPKQGSTDMIIFEISELLRDYIDVTFKGDYLSQAIWFRARAKAYDSSNNLLSTVSVVELALDSYSYFQEPNFDIEETNIMISNREIFVLADNAFKIPIYAVDASEIYFFKNNEVVASRSISLSDNTTSVIKYVSSNPTNAAFINQRDTYAERVVNDGGALSKGIFENSNCLKSFLDSVEIGEVDKIQINVQGKDPVFIKITTIEECKQDPKKITFVNKFGVLQDVYFFKKSVEKISVKRENYKSSILGNILSPVDYDTTKHANRDYNIVGNESMTLSSGYLSEEYNEVFKQMMLSEKCWITTVKNGIAEILPINVKTGDVTYKTSLNNKLVDYTFEFDYSFNVINNIR